jgi:hypothetical protein
MSLPLKSGHDDEQMVRYLLGLLPVEDADRLDEASVVDDDVAARLRQVEDDLIDTYVRGALTGETLARFESHYLATPRRRDRVAFAGKFLQVVDKSSPVGADAEPPATNGSKLVPTLAVAAALLLVAGGTLLLQTVRLGRGLNEAQGQRVALDQRTHELERQLAELRAANATTVQELERARQAPADTPDAPLIALVLLPQTRSLGPMPTVAVPSATGRLGFELRLESNDFPMYQVGLKDPAVNKIVWRSEWIAARASSGQPAVSLSVPRRLLKPQHYSLDLTGRRANGAAEVVGSYAFEIAPQ